MEIGNNKLIVILLIWSVSAKLDVSEDETNKTVLKTIVKDGFTPTMENILKEEERYLVFLSALSKLRFELDPCGQGQNNKTISEDDFNKIFLMTKELHDMHRYGSEHYLEPFLSNKNH